MAGASATGTELDSTNVRRAFRQAITVTEAVCRKQMRPMIQTGATAMDEIFRAAPKA
ncbi:hypothetical protein ACWGE1_17510 [Streptomyces sp. NPDC054932]